MIVDIILDRKDGFKFGKEQLKDMYDESMMFGFDYLSRALDYGTEEDVKKALCRYIDEQDYNPNIKEYINSVNWLKGIYNDSVHLINSWSELISNLDVISDKDWQKYDESIFEFGRKSGLLNDFYDFYKSEGNINYCGHDKGKSIEEMENFISYNDLDRDYRDYINDCSSYYEFEKYVPFKSIFPNGVKAEY